VTTVIGSELSVRLIQALSELLAHVEAPLEEMAFKGVQSLPASLLLRLFHGTNWRGRPKAGRADPHDLRDSYPHAQP
jgi:hypothetical protein